MTPSATPENSVGVIRLIANLPFRRRFLRPPSTEAPSLDRNYPVSSVVRASPPPHTAQPVPRGLPVDRELRSPYRASRVASGLPLSACCHHYPGSDRWNLSARTFPPVSAFPECRAGRLLHWSFRGLLGVYCALRPADSPSRLKRPSTSEAPATSLPPSPLRLLPGGANQFPGGIFNPRWTGAFHGAPTRQDLCPRRWFLASVRIDHPPRTSPQARLDEARLVSDQA